MLITVQLSMYIVLVNRPDRMGANLTWFIMQIIYAHHYKYFIHCYDIVFSDSIFMKTIRQFTDNYNKKLGDECGSHDHGPRLYWIKFNQQDWPGNCMIVCNAIQCDLVSYFKKHLYAEFREILDGFASETFKMDCDFVPTMKKTICVHLRLDDVTSRTDYDGRYSTEYYCEKLNKGNIDINLQEEHLFGVSKNIHIPSWGRCYNPYDCQAPIPESRILTIIDQAREKYPDHTVVVVASPIGEINLPYTCIRSDNTDQDLYYLCNADVLICSRSLYCFSSVYLGNATEIYIPMWGHIAGTGLMTKFDESKLTYWF